MYIMVLVRTYFTETLTVRDTSTDVLLGDLDGQGRQTAREAGDSGDPRVC